MKPLPPQTSVFFVVVDEDGVYKVRGGTRLTATGVWTNPTAVVVPSATEPGDLARTKRLGFAVTMGAPGWRGRT